MTFKANLIRAVIMVGFTVGAVLLTASLAYPTALGLVIVIAFGSLFIGTGVGLEVDERAAKKRRHGDMEHVK
jgi:hypothetical protein